MATLSADACQAVGSKLPVRPAEVPTTASLLATKREAAYLKERVTSSVPRKILRQALDRSRCRDLP